VHGVDKIGNLILQNLRGLNLVAIVTALHVVITAIPLLFFSIVVSFTVHAKRPINVLFFHCCGCAIVVANVIVESRQLSHHLCSSCQIMSSSIVITIIIIVIITIVIIIIIIIVVFVVVVVVVVVVVTRDAKWSVSIHCFVVVVVCFNVTHSVTKGVASDRTSRSAIVTAAVRGGHIVHPGHLVFAQTALAIAATAVIGIVISAIVVTADAAASSVSTSATIGVGDGAAVGPLQQDDERHRRCSLSSDRCRSLSHTRKGGSVVAVLIYRC
jgi:20S proteasome subunit beta 7